MGALSGLYGSEGTATTLQGGRSRNSWGVLAGAQMIEYQLIATQEDASHRSETEENILLIIARV